MIDAETFNQAVCHGSPNEQARALYEMISLLRHRYPDRFRNVTDDVVQETVMHAWQVLDTVDPDVNPFSFLWTVCYRKLCDKQRDQQRYRTRFVVTEVESAAFL